MKRVRTNTVIRKVPRATTNTYSVEIESISNDMRTMKGHYIRAEVMFSSDQWSETISIFDPTTGRQVVLPYAEIERLVGLVRRKRGTEG